MSKKKILLATTNKGKVREFREILGDDFDITDTASEKLQKEIVEDGTSYQENALKKATAYEDYLEDYDLILAEDSGLSINVLSGAPGLQSARFEQSLTYDDKMRRLLQELQEYSDRSATFTSVICVLDAEGNTEYFDGEIKGEIAQDIRGKAGFGYDRIFVPQGYEKTFAELKGEKNEISHRRKAIKEFKKNYT